MRKFLFILCTVLALTARGQNIDSLKQVADAMPLDTSRINLLAFLSNICDPKDIADYAKPAIALSDEYLKKKDLTPRQIRKAMEAKATALSNMGYLYDNQGNTTIALDYYRESTLLYEKYGMPKEASYVLGNIGYVYNSLGDIERASEYFNRSLQVLLKLGDKRGAATTIYNMGGMYNKNKDPKRALEYYLKALEFGTQANYDPIKAQALCSISSMMLSRGEQKKAEEYAFNAFKLTRVSDDGSARANGYIIMGQLFKFKKQFPLALRYLDTAYTLVKESGSISNLLRTEQEYFSVYKDMKDYRRSLEHYTIVNQLQDSINNDESRKASIKSQFKFDFEKKEALLKEQQERERLVAENKNRFQQLVIYGIATGLVLVIIFLVYVFRSLQTNRKANKTITAQKELVEQKNHIIEEKQKEIIDSINYAKRIQYTLLAHKEFLHAYLPEHFVYFNPKDIVSGDFYWAAQHDDKFYLAVCDSTGHGVPGAFMSLLNIGFLAEAIKEKNISEPNKIFNYVRQRLIESVSKEGQKDGFDGILVCFNLSTNSITYTAANNAPVLVHNEQLNILEHDRMPVGIGEKQESFKLYTLPYQKGDTLYLFTDGYADQFGGPKGKKFMYKRLNEKLLSINKQPIQQQETELKRSFNDWRGNLEQVDDVCVIGIRL